MKCSSTGRACLGYEPRLRWTDSVASRGKFSGKSFDVSTSTGSDGVFPPVSSPQRKSTTDILLYLTATKAPPNPQPSSNETVEFYMSYYDSHVCKDLVLEDLPHRNSFRNLLDISRHQPMLREIMIAISALHLANLTNTKHLVGVQYFSQSRSIGSPYKDALVAKSRALCLLADGLAKMSTSNGDVLLATIMLFIMFEMLDSGTKEWRFHTEGARQLMEYLHGNMRAESVCLKDLRASLMSTCIAYNILGTTFTKSSIDCRDCINPSMVQDEDLANTCLSCPPPLLRIIRDVSQCSRREKSERLSVRDADRLVSLTAAFDVLAWVSSLQRISASFDIEKRLHVGMAYKSAVCIYVMRAVSPDASMSEPLEGWVSDILYHLSFIPPGDWFFKATCWPSFIAGAETNNATQRETIISRLEKGLMDLPWGYLANAVRLLRNIWLQKDGGGSLDWLVSLKEAQTDWLIA
ncbi:hypothetical protein LTR84_006994 [Exophiala bonariae]|uniref:Fungal-specific transcription factor domain-containing protein n=1 Tax=Exophiala bonariae TaxID=1690606 RepID=A0AAV9N1I8_9EURO|nr:hypothetical protein LTR84_006994 [Exophiala bonariae]